MYFSLNRSFILILLIQYIARYCVSKVVRKHHRMNKCKSFVFARQYRNCFSRRINALLPRNEPIKTTTGEERFSLVLHDFHGLKTITFHSGADIAYF